MNLYGNGLVSSGGEVLLPDGLGATRQTTSSSQSVVWSGTSQAYGVPLASSGSTVNHYQWGGASGYRTDGFGPTYASALMKVGCRYYDPEFGCFLTRDTVLSQSPYAYCDGDPINFSDPSGHRDYNKPWQTITHAVSQAWNNVSSLSDSSVKAIKSGFGALTTGLALIPIWGAWENMQTQNQGLANEKWMLNNYENTHDNPDMTQQWGLYNYYQTGTLKADGAFAGQAANQYLHMY